MFLVSDMGVHCLSLSHKIDTGLIWVNLLPISIVL